MNRALLILLSGLAAGAGAHVAYFRAHRPCAGEALDCQLAWMRDDLQLSDAQFARIKQLHEASSPRVQMLAAEVERVGRESSAFERERLRADQVDFIAFAQLLETRRTVGQECTDSARRLVLASAGVMTQDQRRRYFGLVHPLLPPPAQKLRE